jgi:predicted SAM-dependent methyltransferase
LQDSDLRATVDNLTRVWVRVQNEVARLSSMVPELEARLGTLQVHPGNCNLNGGTLQQARSVAVQPRILAPEKVEAALAAGALRLHLGGGPVPEPGWVTVDVLDRPDVDAIAEASALPFEPGSVDEIFSLHLVERYSREETTHRLLPHWYRLLGPSGRLRIVTSDGEAMLAALAEGRYAFEDFREMMFGDSHRDFFTPDSLRRMVEDAGFAAVEVSVRGRQSGRCFEFELVAHVPAVTKPR